MEMRWYTAEVDAWLLQINQDDLTRSGFGRFYFFNAWN